MKSFRTLYKQNNTLCAGILLFIVILFIALFAPFIAPYNALDVSIDQRLIHPCRQHIAGTDALGRDVFSRLLMGARITLASSFIIIAVNLIISIPLGIVTGYAGGAVDVIISFFMNMVMAFPQIIISLYLLANWGQGFQNLLLSMIAVGWVKYTRLIRGNTKKIKHSDYIKAAKVSGSSDIRIAFAHILPNVITSILSLAALDVSRIILSISALSFLGLGITPPTPEWGIMLNEARPFINSHAYMMWAPGLCILIVVLCFNLLGRGLKKSIQL